MRVVLAMAACATLAACGAPEKVVSEHWAGPTATPHGEEYRPRGAIGRGDVILKCVMADGGRLSACAIEKEDPAGWGFGPAALRMTEKMIIKDPLALGSEVRVPITFKAPGED